MLQAAAREIQHRLGDRYAYRIGGDEFIVFCVDEDKDAVLRRSEAVAAALEEKGYHISAGVDWRPVPVDDMDELVKAAEKRMYEAKRAYYQIPGHDRRAR